MRYENFNLTGEIDSYIQADNRNKILDTLISVCVRDRNFSTKEFYEAIDYITKRANPPYPEEKLYDSACSPNYPLYRKKIDAGESVTTADYATAVTNLRLNFCKERIEDTRLLGEKLYPIPKSQKGNKPVRPQTGRNAATHSNIIILVAAVIIVLLIIILLR